MITSSKKFSPSVNFTIYTHWSLRLYYLPNFSGNFPKLKNNQKEKESKALFHDFGISASSITAFSCNLNNLICRIPENYFSLSLKSSMFY